MLGVGRADLRGADAADIPGALLGGNGILRRNERTFIPARRGKHGFRRKNLIVDVLIAQYTLHHRKAVRLIVNCEALREAETVGIAPQNAHAGAVKCERPHIAPNLAELVLQTAFQLVRSFVRERDCEHLPRSRRVNGTHAADIVRHGCVSGSGVLKRREHFLVRARRELSRVCAAAKAEDVLHAVDQNRCFPAARAREQKQRAFRCQNGFALFRVQIGIFFFNDLPPCGGKPAGKVLGHGEISSVSLI